MIRGAVFDCGGVLVTLGEAEYRAAVAQRLGLPVLPNCYAQSIPALQRGDMPEEEVWVQVAERPVPLDAFDDIFAAHFRPVEAMLQLAAELRRMGLMTAILSNTQVSHARVLRRMGFMESFGPVALSCEMGARKPEPEAYQIILDQMGLAPDEVVFVDDMVRNIDAAEMVGMQTLLHTGDTAATRQALLSLVGVQAAG
ncbi:MAG: HAD family hydrolase [Mycobacterium leprae]